MVTSAVAGVNVDVTVLTSRGNILAAEYGHPLVVTEEGSSVLSAGGPGKIKSYVTLEEVAQDFAASTNVYRVAASYYGRRPYPKALRVGRRVTADVDSVLQGSAGASTDLSAVTDGAFTFQGYTFSGINFATATDNTAAKVAATLQTALRSGTVTPALPSHWDAHQRTGAAGRAGIAVTAEGGAYKVTFPAVIPLMQGTFGPPAEGTDISEDLGLGSSARLTIGGLKEDGMADTLSALVRHASIGNSFNSLLLDRPDHPLARDASNWAEQNDRLIYLQTVDRNVLVDNEVASTLAAIRGGGGRVNTIGCYSMSPGLDAMAANIFGGINLDRQRNLTLKYHEYPGRLPDDLSGAEIRELERKGVNHYTGFFAQGTTMSVDQPFAYAAHWSLWFKWRMSRDLLRLFGNADDPVSIDSEGRTRIFGVVQNVCNAGVANKGIRPGRRLTDAIRASITARTGDPLGATLPSGYHIWIAPETDEQLARSLPPDIYVWVTGGAFAHGVNLFAFIQQ